VESIVSLRNVMERFFPAITIPPFRIPQKERGM
jgi:hypothetical protein